MTSARSTDVSGPFETNSPISQSWLSLQVQLGRMWPRSTTVTLEILTHIYKCAAGHCTKSQDVASPFTDSSPPIQSRESLLRGEFLVRK